ADVTCLDYDPHCRLPTRASNMAVPKRMALTQMRSNDSSTSISCSTIWTGLSPADTEKNLRSAPTLWRYAKAAGYDTSYLTSQHIIFHNMREQMQDEPIDHFACGTTVDPLADFDTGALDDKLSDYAIAHWGELKEPFFAVVQYSNQHYPYVADPAKSPFPYDAKQDKKAHKNLFAFYENVVYLSDLAVGKLLEHIRKSPSSERTVIVYTADHGEAFGAEHRISGHTHSIFENEIRVPGWIDAPAGTLTAEEEASIRGARTTLLYHLDLAPTFLDLLGLWDDPALAPYRARMPGHPLTRPERTTGPVLFNNCAWIWEAQTPNWGAMDGTKKLIGRPDWGGAYHCHDVVADPNESKNLGEEACGSLGALVRTVFPPFGGKHPVHPLN
ncbi:MAG: sulfatase-like hydrolase/transferase, partial [Minicystis sp.]